jgi:hypothetical protein
MFNISDRTVILGLEKTGCTVGQIQRCLRTRAGHDEPEFSLFDLKISAGEVVLHTENGDFTMRFHEEGGWADLVEFI